MTSSNALRPEISVLSRIRESGGRKVLTAVEMTVRGRSPNSGSSQAAAGNRSASRNSPMPVDGDVAALMMREWRTKLCSAWLERLRSPRSSRSLAGGKPA